MTIERSKMIAEQMICLLRECAKKECQEEAEHLRKEIAKLAEITRNLSEKIVELENCDHMNQRERGKANG